MAAAFDSWWAVLAENGDSVPVEMAIWRMTDTELHRLAASPLDFEHRLEDMLAETPSMIGMELLIVGRQVTTSFGGVVDLLGLDADGRVHVLELKRDRTPRDVVAQVLDYGSWAEALSLEGIERLFAEHRGDDTTLEVAFADHFGAPLPEVVNAGQQFTIVASELDPASERIVRFLAESYEVPINAIFFRHFADGDRDYIARTWLREPQSTDGTPARASRSKRRPWNGRDYYTILGRADGEPERYEIASKYGYLSAGGGSWYWKPLRNLKPGARVFAYVGGAGYVGIARVTGEMIRALDATVEVDGEQRALLDQPEVSQDMRERAVADDLEVTEMVVPVEWLSEVPLNEAVSEPGLFSSQVIVCKLRDERTIDTVETALGINSTT